MKALAKQIVGHGKKVVFDDQEAQRDYLTLRNLQADTRQLLAQLDAFAKSSESYSTDGKNVLECYESLGPKWQKEGFDDVSRVVRGSVGLLRQSQTLGLQLDQEVAASVARPLRDLNDVEFAKAKQLIKKTQEQRAVYQDLVVNMEREKKKGKVTALDAENQIKRAGADYDICEAECKKVMRSAIESAQTCTILISCNYLAAYTKFWEAGAKMNQLLLATAGKHRQVAAERAERSKADENRVLKCFGVELEEVVRRDGKPPQFVFELISHISSVALEEEGIFRVPGNLEALNQFKKRIDSGLTTGIVKEIGTHDAAGLLKLYLRELPSPLIPYDAFNALVKINVKSIGPEDTSKRAEVMAVLGKLPLFVYQILKELVYMAMLIASKSAVNKMDAANIARSLAPGLMRSQENTSDMMAVLAASHASNDLFEHLIENYTLYFERSLHALAASGNLEAIRKVMQFTPAGSPALGRDDSGRTVLHCAAAEGHSDMVEYLLDSAPSVSLSAADNEGNTALHLAVLGEHIETAGLLLHRGASMDSANKTGNTVWMLANVVSADCAKKIQDCAASFKSGNLRASKRIAVDPIPVVSSKSATAVSPRSDNKPAASSGTMAPHVSGSPLTASSPLPMSSSQPHSLTSVPSTGSLPPPRPRVKETVVSVTSTHEEVVVALQAPAPPLPRRGSQSFNKSSKELVVAGSPPEAAGTPLHAVQKQQQARVSTAKAIPLSRISQAAGDTPDSATDYVWKHIVAEPFYDISSLVGAVSSFCMLLCDQDRNMDTLAVRQSLKDVARGLQTFFKALELLVTPFQDDDSASVRDVAGRLKDCAGELLNVVRDVSSAPTGGSKVHSNQARLEQQAFRLVTTTLELFDSIEVARYRLINQGMQKTAEEAAALSKTTLASEVALHREEIKKASASLASMAVCKALKLWSEPLVMLQLQHQVELLQMVRDIRHPEATTTSKGLLAKNIILSFRGMKSVWKEADEKAASESRSDGELLESACGQLLEIRAPDDYAPENKSEGLLLASVASVHDALQAAASHFASGAWRMLGKALAQVETGLEQLLVTARLLQQLCPAGSEAATKTAAHLAALEYHRARFAAISAHAAIVDHCRQPERDVSLRRMELPVLDGYLRPGIATAGLVVALLQSVPDLFKLAKRASK